MVQVELVIETNQKNIKSDYILSCGDRKSWKYIFQLFIGNSNSITTCIMIKTLVEILDKENRDRRQ